MDWSSIIEAAITSGAFVGIFMIAEKKTAALLEAVDKRSSAMIQQTKELLGEYRKLADERQEECAVLQDRGTRKEEKIVVLQKEISALHHELDEAHTVIAVKSLMYCRDAKCIQRDPPFGCSADELIAQARQKAVEEERRDGNNQ